jgi:hypothetical protein
MSDTAGASAGSAADPAELELDDALALELAEYGAATAAADVELLAPATDALGKNEGNEGSSKLNMEGCNENPNGPVDANEPAGAPVSSASGSAVASAVVGAARLELGERSRSRPRGDTRKTGADAAAAADEEEEEEDDDDDDDDMTGEARAGTCE